MSWYNPFSWFTKSTTAVSLDDSVYVEFVAEGKTIRVDPFVAIDWLVALENQFKGSTETNEYLIELGKNICERYGIKACTSVGAWRFQEAVVNSYTAHTQELKKKIGSEPNLRGTSELIPAGGMQDESMSGSDSPNGCMPMMT